MIYTVTLNPALDYVIHVEQFKVGNVNRVSSEQIYYGGKGINVSVILKELGHTSTALGFTAGFTGEEIVQGVKALGIASDFIHVKEGRSRINVKLKADTETEINGIGPKIEPEDVTRLFDMLMRLVEEDVLVLSGSIPSSLDSRIYETMMERLAGKGIRIIVDAERDLLLNVLKYRPFLIKPNHHELGAIFGVELSNEEEIVAYAGKLQEQGAVNVLVSMAGDGAILLTEEGTVHKMGVPKGMVKNSVGAGDSMVAGFIAGYLDKHDYSYALKLGSACGSATAFSDGLARREEIIRLLETIS